MWVSDSVCVWEREREREREREGGERERSPSLSHCHLVTLEREKVLGAGLHGSVLS